MREYLSPDDYVRAEKNGIPAGCVNHRFSAGWSKERTLTQKYRAITNVWEKYKDESLVGLETFKSRIRRGWSPEESATIPVGTKRPNRKRS